MATYKTISSADIKTTRSILNQLVDFIEEDVSGSQNQRKRYQVFVTGTSDDPGVTSSIFHTVFDQDHTLQTANELFDMTVGIFSGSDTVANCSTGEDTNGKLLFPSTSLMMREKVNIYRQYAQLLLGDAEGKFFAPFSSTATTNQINECFFLNFKRLFVRDGIKRETFAMRFFQSMSAGEPGIGTGIDGCESPVGEDNLRKITTSGSVIFTDLGSATSIERSNAGGDVGNIVNSANTSETVGLLFYQQGIALFDLSKITSASQYVTGAIDGVGNSAGKVRIGDIQHTTTDNGFRSGNARAKFIPDFITSASMDDILDHIASVRFGSAAQTCIAFQNNTQINSTLIFCRATADEFNFSSNPTYTDTEGRIRVIDESQQGLQKAFTFVTTVGLYDANEQLLAVSKLSRPIEKNDEKDLTFRVRLDF